MKRTKITYPKTSEIVMARDSVGYLTSLLNIHNLPITKFRNLASLK
jgi:hypothetical protein